MVAEVQMRDFRRFRPTPLAVVCLLFTGGGVAWGDRHTPDLYIEDPYAPHHTTGSEARIGTAVGFLYNEPVDVTALGATAAIGYRFGRLTLETEYAYLGFQVKGPDDTSLGAGQRLSALGRFDIIRLGPRIVGQNSLLSIYIEGGGGTSWNHWYTPAYDQASRIVPADTRRAEGELGFGISIDHRLQEPIGFPHRVGWFLGWRVAMSPHQPMVASVCRGISCRPIEMTDDNRLVDRSMLFQSSLAFTF